MIFLKVFGEMIFEDENDTSGMQEVLKRLHDFVPCEQVQEPNIFGCQGVVGDQLTVDRGVNGLLQLGNGFTKKDRLDGLHFEIADFHAGMKFLQVTYFLLLYIVYTLTSKIDWPRIYNFPDIIFLKILYPQDILSQIFNTL